jgi:lipoate-protein ligase A
MVHGSLIETLADFGVRANTVGQAVPDDSAVRHSLTYTEPFLCFQRRAASDVVVGETKIAGSAQRRRRGAVLQHGSVLLGRSAAAPELPGLAELARRTFSPERLTEVWLTKLAGRLAPCWCPGTLTAEESRQAAALAENHYESSAWTENRGKPSPPEL